MSEPKHLLPLKTGLGLSHNRFLSLVPWPHVLLQALQEDQEPHIPLTTKEKSKEERNKRCVFLPFLPEINFLCKVIKESLGLNTGFHAVNSSFQVLKFGFLVSGIWALEYIFHGFLDSLGWAPVWIPNRKIPYSRRKHLLGSGIWIALHGVTFKGNLKD